MFDESLLLKELSFKAIRSSGAGGQHVNKVASKVELTFILMDSSVLSEEQKQTLLVNLKNRLSKDKSLIIQCDESRSQHKNKTIIIQRFLKIIREGLIEPKERIRTKIPKAAVKQRLLNKKKQSEKKAKRKSPGLE